MLTFARAAKKIKMPKAYKVKVFWELPHNGIIKTFDTLSLFL